jgi:Cof subfamily protein (haloacid dehalogenase superfamily)
VSPLRLLISDVDGTLVTPDKELTPATIAAVAALGDAGVLFAVTSGRPPRGLAMLIEPLQITTPVCAFNGGVVATPQMEILIEHAIDPTLVPTILAALGESGIDPWLFQGTDWFVRDLHGPHVEREIHACQFSPEERESLDGLVRDVAKLVGVHDDPVRIAAAHELITARVGDTVSASSSQPYYLDVTHRDANKGWVVDYFVRTLEINHDEIAVIGDAANDVLMFNRAGTAIAMGNATPEVRAAAAHTTASNSEDGFARAVTEVVLTHV